MAQELERKRDANQLQQQRKMLGAILLDKMQAAFRVTLEPTENQVWLEDLLELLEEVGEKRTEGAVKQLIRTWKREYGKTYFPMIGELRDCVPAPEFKGTLEKYEPPEETPELQRAREEYRAKLHQIVQGKAIEAAPNKSGEEKTQ